MSVPRPPRKKPSSIDEITRVLRIYDCDLTGVFHQAEDTLAATEDREGAGT